MKNNIYLACGLMALAFAACSEDNGIVGTSTEPNTFAHDFSSSEAESLSSSVTEKSSSSDFGFSSSTAPLTSSSVEMTSSSAKIASSSSVLPELESSSSMVLPVLSSSSYFPMFPSSIYYPPPPCKASYWGGCAGVGAKGDLWSGYDVAYDGAEHINVNVGLYADSSWKSMASGEWFIDVDSADGGESNIRWPVELGDDSNPNSLVPVIEDCYNGLCGTIVLKKGSLNYNPFVSIGFTLAKDSTGKPIPVDVSNWKGICIVYESQTAPSLELDLGDSVNAHIDYALPAASLPRASYYAAEKCIEWSQFKFPSWYKHKPEDWADEPNVGERAAKQLVAVRFNIRAQSGEYDFNIMAIGTNLE